MANEDPTWIRLESDEDCPHTVEINPYAPMGHPEQFRNRRKDSPVPGVYEEWGFGLPEGVEIAWNSGVAGSRTKIFTKEGLKNSS